MKYNFELNINKKDYELLKKYGFAFEKNFEQQVKDVANEIRRCLKEDWLWQISENADVAENR